MARRQRPFWPIERTSASRSYLAGRGVNNRCAKRLRPVAAGTVMRVSSWLAGFQRYAWVTAPAYRKITWRASTSTRSWSGKMRRALDDPQDLYQTVVYLLFKRNTCSLDATVAPRPKETGMLTTWRVPLAALALVFGSILAAGSASASAMASHPGAANINPGGLMTRPAGQVSGSQKSHLNEDQSTNWSGYAATGGTGAFSSVSASWVEPAGTCT